MSEIGDNEVLAEFLATIGNTTLAEHGQHDIVHVPARLIAIARVEQCAAEKFIRCTSCLARPEGQLIATLSILEAFERREKFSDLFGHG